LWRRRGTIERAVAGELSPPREQVLREHLRGCDDCRGYYDQLVRIMAVLAPGVEHKREGSRLSLAVGTADAPVVSPPARSVSSSRMRWLGSSSLVVAAAAAVLLFVWRPFQTAQQAADGEIGWRGGGDESTADWGLLVYASRRTNGDTQPTVRLVADLPRSGEGRLNLDDYVQFSVRGLRQVAYVTIVGLDEGGEVHLYAPRPEAPRRPLALAADGAPRMVGPSIDLSVKHRSGRLRLFAVVTPGPANIEELTAAAKRAGFSGTLQVPGEQVTGLLAITR
jgi:hypothetical protein